MSPLHTLRPGVCMCVSVYLFLLSAGMVFILLYCGNISSCFSTKLNAASFAEGK